LRKIEISLRSFRWSAGVNKTLRQPAFHLYQLSTPAGCEIQRAPVESRGTIESERLGSLPRGHRCMRCRANSFARAHVVFEQ
jgi:hypothetical protein